MAESDKRKGGSKLARSETVTVRLDPKLRYLAELAARKQRRSLSSYIEWAVEDSLARVPLREDMNNRASVGDESSYLWDVDEADRFARLALRYPDLLTHEEQVRWKLIRENGLLWRGSYATGKWSWSVDEGSLIFDRLREHWAKFCSVAESGSGHDTLPSWAKTKPAGYGTAKPPEPSTKSTGFDNMDDDVPF
jgi:hypothetical protein